MTILTLSPRPAPATPPVTLPVPTRTSTVPPTSTVADFATIGLPGLLASAERLTRVDRKYLVPQRELPALLGSITDQALVLEIDGRRQFGYRSTYFDTFDLRSFYEAGRGRRRRFKIRTRVYLDSGDAFLEVKTRGPRGTTVKDRIPLGSPEAGPFTPDDAAFVAAQLATAQVHGIAPNQLLPTLITAYRRSTLLFPGRDGQGDRVTIDTDLGWSTVGTTSTDLDRPSLAIIETKAGSTPTVMDRQLWRRGFRPVRVSKYGTGLAALNPDLPHLKWHRLLTRAFAA